MSTTTRLRFRYRLEPTVVQSDALNRAFGCARVVFNDAVRTREAAHSAGQPYPSYGDLSRALTLAKRTPEREWLTEVSAVVLQQALVDADRAYRNFFASTSGIRKGRPLGQPRFKSRKDGRQSIRFSKAARFRITHDRRLRLPLIGDVRVIWPRAMPTTPLSVTITRDPAGRYHASFVVEQEQIPLPPVRHETGIDLGLTSFAALSDGRKLDNPRWARKAQRKLARAQRALSRKQLGSKNRRKAVARVARLHARVADTRRDWLHQESTKIIRDSQAVFVEDLNVAGLARTRMARSIADAGWSTFVGMLEYKAALYGREFAKIDRWFPSTRTCSTCGRVGDKLALNVRTWTCPCGAVHDRDVNAAINILAAGRADRSTPVETTSDLGETGAVVCEAGTHRKRGLRRAGRKPHC